MRPALNGRTALARLKIPGAWYVSAAERKSQDKSPALAGLFFGDAVANVFWFDRTLSTGHAARSTPSTQHPVLSTPHLSSGQHPHLALRERDGDGARAKSFDYGLVDLARRRAVVGHVQPGAHRDVDGRICEHADFDDRGGVLQHPRVGLEYFADGGQCLVQVRIVSHPHHDIPLPDLAVVVQDF